MCINNRKKTSLGSLIYLYFHVHSLTRIYDISANPTFHLVLFAHDIVLVSDHRDLCTLCCTLQYHLQKVVGYFNDWKLQINPPKTQATIFTTKTNPVPLPLTMENVQLLFSRKVKYLDLMLDKYDLGFLNVIFLEISTAENFFYILVLTTRLSVTKIS